MNNSTSLPIELMIRIQGGVKFQIAMKIQPLNYKINKITIVIVINILTKSIILGTAKIFNKYTEEIREVNSITLLIRIKIKM